MKSVIYEYLLLNTHSMSQFYETHVKHLSIINYCTHLKNKDLPTTLAMKPFFITMLIILTFILALPQLSLYLPGIFK